MHVKETAQAYAIEVYTYKTDDPDYISEHITHAALVANRVEGKQLETVAGLHDIIEDAYVTIRDIELNVDDISQDELNAINTITRRKDEPYFDYIERVSKNGIATYVKIADLCVNIEHCLCVKTEKSKSLLGRYYKALGILRFRQLTNGQ